MGSLLTVLLPAIAPALTDGVRGIFAKFTGGAGGTPVNVGERIQLMQAETARLEALAKIDQPAGQPSQWVTDLRGSFRYLTIAAVWIVAGAAIATDAPELVVVPLLDIAGASMAFIIGERMYFNLKR